jgi:cytochrome bd ubiquinol oxidase subunit II
MFDLWFGIVAVMLTLYVVLDGYDLGVGALHLLVARNDSERRQALAAIGPFWDASEVWLLASGGALFVAFPRVLASGLSGFYLAIFLVIWSLILRGIAIEFRSHVAEPLWRGFWDATFAVASVLLAVLLGVAIGNVIRGLPLDDRGWFSLALFTSFQPRSPVGILDWYTVLIGVFALLVLAGHGALYLAWKTAGPVHDRADRLALGLWSGVAVLWPLVTWATNGVNHAIPTALPGRPLGWLGAALAVAGIVAVFRGRARGRHLWAFLGSCAFIAGLLAATAACVFPVMLRSIGDPALSITAHAGGSSPEGLRTALKWWVIGFPLALGYFVVLFRIHRGKAVAARDGEGY